MAGSKHFSVEQKGDVTVIRLVDPRMLDTLIVSEFQDELLQYLESEKPDKVLVDFEGVSHCSTAVINGLLRAKKRIMEWNGQLKLCRMSPAVREAYRLLNLDGTVFQIYNTEEAAAADFYRG